MKTFKNLTPEQKETFQNAWDRLHEAYDAVINCLPQEINPLSSLAVFSYVLDIEPHEHGEKIETCTSGMLNGKGSVITNSLREVGKDNPAFIHLISEALEKESPFERMLRQILNN